MTRCAARARIDGRRRRRARRGGRRWIAALTVPVPAELDLSAAVLAARRPGRPLLLLRAARPRRLRAGRARRGGRARGGRARALQGGGRGGAELRPARRGGRGRRDDRARHPAPGLSSSAASRSRTTAARVPSGPRWRLRRSCCPELGFARQDGEARMTISTAVAPDDDPDALAERLTRPARGARPGVDAAARSRSGRARTGGERGTAVALRARRRARGRAHPRG